MTQTFPKPADQTATNRRGTQSSTSEQIDAHATDRGDHLPPALNSSLQQVTQDSNESKLLESKKVEQIPKRQGFALSHQLLMTILPVALTPLVIAGGLSWSITNQRASERTDVKLWNDAMLSSDLIGGMVDDAFAIVSDLAENPLVINAARTGTKQAEVAGLNKLPANEAERRFAATKKILNSDPALNGYLRKNAHSQNLSKLLFTERNGFNIASGTPIENFVQSGENWWQKGKKEGQWFSEPEQDKASIYGVELVKAIKDPASGEFLGVIRGRKLITSFNDLWMPLEHVGISRSEQVQILDPVSKTIITTITSKGPIEQRQLLGGEPVLQKAEALLAELQAHKPNSGEKLSPGRKTSYVATREQLQGINIIPFVHEEGQFVLTTTSFIDHGIKYSLAIVPGRNWVSVTSIELSEVSAAGNEQGLIFILISLLLGALAAATILFLARRLSAPLNDLSNTAEQVALGDLDVYAQARGTTETQSLAKSFNNLVARVKILLAEQEEGTRQQVANHAQEEIARQQAESAEQQRLAKEQLQQRALELLMEVDPVSKGDLTIRAKVTSDEIGTIADSYNATIGSLRQLVIQVQTAAKQVAVTTSSSEVSVQELSAEALRQAQEIATALERIQEMSNSIRAVATSAEQAEAAVLQSDLCVKEGDAAMNRTVDGILAIRDTVAQTSIKVKQLGESSQKISKVVNLIGRFAAQTNLLALKASIEAARAGEQGKGFGVLADEVRSLARQSAQATAEIESLVKDIQTETNSVVAAMKAGTEQVVTGTKMVDETRQSLNQITAVSAQIGGLVSAIASATVAQSQASESVTQTMSDVAAIAQHTSTEATLVSASFKELLAVATELQTSAGQFKVS